MFENYYMKHKNKMKPFGWFLKYKNKIKLLFENSTKTTKINIYIGGYIIYKYIFLFCFVSTSSSLLLNYCIYC